MFLTQILQYLDVTLKVAFVALVIDMFIGDPKGIWSRVWHPVVLIGKLIDYADRRFNIEKLSATQLRRRGLWVAFILILLSLLAGGVIAVISWQILEFNYSVGIITTAIFASIFMAQKSLIDHVTPIVTALQNDDLALARQHLSHIVGRDTKHLGKEEIIVAATETTAENFVDAVYAPTFWLVLGGFPGLIAYKTINTLDSMLGHKSDRFRNFGWASARIDDLANWLPARLSVWVIYLASAARFGRAAARRSLVSCKLYAGQHDSPNAGIAEAMFAGALDITLGGRRSYGDKWVELPEFWPEGRKPNRDEDLTKALSLEKFAAIALLTKLLIIMVCCWLLWQFLTIG